MAVPLLFRLIADKENKKTPISALKTFAASTNYAIDANVVPISLATINPSPKLCLALLKNLSTLSDQRRTVIPLL